MKAICLPADKDIRYYHGVCNSAIVQLLCAIKQELKHSVHVVVCENSHQLEQTHNDLIDFSNLYKKDIGIEIVLLPALPDLEENSARNLNLECDRLTALSKMLDYRDKKQKKSLFVLTTPNGFFEASPRSSELLEREIQLQRFKEYNYNSLIEKLGTVLGYSNEVVCEMPGQYAIRGGLLDVYPVNASSPYRIDFFGDEIESLRTFDPATQLTIGEADRLTISSLPVPNTGINSRNIFDYFSTDVAWVFLHPQNLNQKHPDYFSIFEHSFSSRPSFQDLIDDRSKTKDSFIGIALLESENAFFTDLDKFYAYKTQELDVFRESVVEYALGVDLKEAEDKSIEAFFDQIKKWHKLKYKLRFFARTESEKEKIELRLKSRRMSQYKVEISTLRKGFIYEESDELSHIFITANDIYARLRSHPVHRSNRMLPQRQSVEQLLDFSELVEGDLLVHLANGVCRFRGIQEIEFKRGKEEVIALEFDNDSSLYLPLQESHLLTRYVGLSKSSPKLANLGSNQWEKSRRAAEQATLDYAAALLKTQAEREVLEGYAFSKDNEWQKSFEQAFPFEETRDQLKAINAVKEDMESILSMDRLICGDVGFGKTEVAIRAAFKAVMDGKQVAVLVPTTVLAQQHYQTFKERMDAYPVTVEMVSRFRSKKEQKEILKQCNEGKVDILVGTHRLLSQDIVFKDLGLLIVDEEHRFGVKHKERLKELSYKVDILTMSATPIPRTLYMALVGVRKLSVIETAPVNRLPIQTFVKSYDLALIKKAIKHELDRGGQVFYLHNRVQSIESVAEGLRELLPNARIGVGHGQMTENALEKLMTQFVEAKYDVLVCTTIIESGLDIPNCNTIIIEGADKFGLAQLYQLRGRVGRFNKQAYAYLLLHQKTHILDQAKKRLGAIREYNQLGAGYKIAMQDLELRGAGNILGMKQSGHIVSIGFDLYCQLLKQSISKLKGEETSNIIRASVSLDFIKTNSSDNASIMEFSGNPVEDMSRHDEAGFPTSYIPDARLRIDFYRQLALSDTEETIEKTKESIVDRFGKLPACAETLLEVTKIRVFAELARVDLVEVTNDVLRCRRASGRRDDYIKLTSQFPRLTRKAPLLRLREIQTFLRRHTHTT